MSEKEDKQPEKEGSSQQGINRRDFIQGLATVPILGALAYGWHKDRSLSAGDQETTTTNGESADTSGEALNVAFLGAGQQGQVLLNSCLKISGLRFRAVCDIWEEYSLKRVSRMLKKYDHEVNTYIDHREMLEKETELDAVIIATPDFWHARHTIDCLEAGLHVYCEKEMSNTVEDARKMVIAARNTGKLLQIGHQRRSNPQYLHCYNNLLRKAELLGRISSVNGQWNRSVHPDLGWPKKYAIPDRILKKYGYDSMHQYRNWRWYKGLGGGPIVDLGSHQIDIYNWFLNARPKTVTASGGTNYYDQDTHEWYDNVMAIYEYETSRGMVRAYYQTLTMNSSEGYFENFLGDEGTIHISESANRGGVYREPGAPPWDEWVNKGYLTQPIRLNQPDAGAVLDVRETVGPEKHGLPVELNDPYHYPHLKNFFNAVRGKEKLNCPPETGFETAVTVLKVNQAIEKGMTLSFDNEEFGI